MPRKTSHQQKCRAPGIFLLSFFLAIFAEHVNFALIFSSVAMIVLSTVPFPSRTPARQDAPRTPRPKFRPSRGTRPGAGSRARVEILLSAGAYGRIFWGGFGGYFLEKSEASLITIKQKKRGHLMILCSVVWKYALSRRIPTAKI